MSEWICRINDYLAETARLLDQLDRAAIARAAELLLECYRRQGRVWTLGNGGSASTAQHFACDLAKFVIPPGARPFDTRCLTDNVSLLTAWANDAAREDVFANQMRGLARHQLDPQWSTPDADAIALRKEAVRRILPWVDLVHGNVHELNRFGDSGDLDTTLRQITAWGAGAIVIHMGADGAGYYRNGQLTVSPSSPVQRYKNTAGTGDLLSVCMMLLHGRDEILLQDRLHLANTIVAEFIEGKRGVIPELA